MIYGICNLNQPHIKVDISKAKRLCDPVNLKAQGSILPTRKRPLETNTVPGSWDSGVLVMGVLVACGARLRSRPCSRRPRDLRRNPNPNSNPIQSTTSRVKLSRGQGFQRRRRRRNWRLILSPAVVQRHPTQFLNFIKYIVNYPVSRPG